MKDFYPRPPWGGRPAFSGKNVVMRIFLSTPSVGRATSPGPLSAPSAYISIHALRGEGDSITVGHTDVRTISIHALRGEGDGQPASGA